MHKLTSELKNYYEGADLVDGRRTAFESIFMVNSDWDAETKALARKTWDVAWSYGCILEEKEVIALLKKYGKYKSQDEMQKVWRDGKLRSLLD